MAAIAASAKRRRQESENESGEEDTENEDEAELKKSYANPDRFDDTRLFPNTQLEVTRPTKQDFWGFLICFAICFVIIGLIVLVAQIGAGGTES